MGTVTVSEVLRVCRKTLHDPDLTRWPDPELISYLNDGLLDIASKTDAVSSEVTNLQLVAGPLQTITGLRLIDVNRNMGVDGLTQGRAVRRTKLKIMDSYSPDWAASNAAQVVRNWMPSGRNPRQFYIWPPQPAIDPVQVEIEQIPKPTEARKGSDVVDLRDEYIPALTNYVLFRAFSKDADVTANPGRAKEFKELYDQAFAVGGGE